MVSTPIVRTFRYRCLRTTLNPVWDSRTLLKDVHQDQAHYDSTARRTSRDDPPCKHNSCFSEKHEAHGDSKIVLLYIEREDLFELDTSAISRASSKGVSLSDALLGRLGWLKSSCPTGVILHQAEGNLASSAPVRTLATLWEVINSQELPIFECRAPQPPRM